MKYYFTFLLAVVASLSSSAQSFEIRRDTSVTTTTDKFEVETNRFWQNWFIGASTGAQLYYGDHNKQMELGDRITPAFEFYVGKFFTPVLGLRLGINGFKANGLTQNGSYVVGPYDKLPWEGYWLERQELNFINISQDVGVNIQNLFSGYKPEGRFYELIAYGGLGIMMITKNRDKTDAGGGRELSANIGVTNQFRLSKALRLTVEARASMIGDNFDGENGSRLNDGNLRALVGLKYLFGKDKGWKRPKTVEVTYNEADINMLRATAQKLVKDNEQLKKQLAESKSSTITDIKVENNLLVAPILVTFKINESIVSNEARVNLGFFADIIKQGDSNIKYNITGYADSGTGTPQINDRLSRERSDAIYNVLVREFGVSPAQLVKDYKGGVENMYYDDPRLSRAVIVIAD